MRDGKPIILFECKGFEANLDDVHASQLYRYFSVTEARFGILTNGVVYQFFTDLEAPNKMDTKPFLVFDMLDIKEPLVEELKKFTKAAFDVDQIISTASELKYTNAIKKLIVDQLAQPSEEFVRFFASQVYSGQLRQHVLMQFTEITKRAWREVITDRIRDTFTKAAQEAGNKTNQEQEPVAPVAPDNKIVTTEEEQEAFRIVRAIVREVVDVKRVVVRDAQSYCSILLDDNNRKPICRLYFNAAKKHIGVFNDQKEEQRIHIESLEDIFQQATSLKATVSRYLSATV